MKVVMMKMVIYSMCLALIFVFFSISLNAQSAPAEDENIPYLVTFGANADVSWGDDDFCQTFFFKIPSRHTEPFYIRVFDPDTGGELDEMKDEFNTSIQFLVYGGIGNWSNKDAKGIDPVGQYDSGNLMASHSFDDNKRYDKEWYTFGPFYAKEGEYVEKLGGYVFKVIAKGMSGNDGNLYKYFMSTEKNENIPIEGGNVFTYEYAFRLSNNQNNVSQIYPYIDDKVTSVKILNYDWDNDGFIRVVSVAKRGVLCNISNDKEWESMELKINEIEHETSMEIQFIKNRSKLIKNNNVVLVVQNQYGESLPFYVIPIGGIPVYRPVLRMKAVERK